MNGMICGFIDWKLLIDICIKLSHPEIKSLLEFSSCARSHILSFSCFYQVESFETDSSIDFWFFYNSPEWESCTHSCIMEWYFIHKVDWIKGELLKGSLGKIFCLSVLHSRWVNRRFRFGKIRFLRDLWCLIHLAYAVCKKIYFVALCSLCTLIILFLYSFVKTFHTIYEKKASNASNSSPALAC